MGELDQGTYSRSDTAPPKPKPSAPTTADAVNQLLERYRNNAAVLASYGDEPLTESNEQGQLTYTDAGAAYVDISRQQKILEESLTALGYNPKTGGAGGGGRTADSLASEGLGYAKIAQDDRLAAQRIAADKELAQMGDSRARDIATQQEGGANSRATAQNDVTKRGQDVTTRGQNLDSVLKSVDQEIARGNYDLAYGAQKVKAVTDAANLERDYTKDWAPWAVAPGAQYFPGLEPNGPISSLAAALGFSGLSMPTGGTMNINPAALAAPITAAANAIPNASGNISSAFDRAMAAIQGLGVPLDTRAGRPPGADPMTAALAGGTVKGL